MSFDRRRCRRRLVESAAAALCRVPAGVSRGFGARRAQTRCSAVAGGVVAWVSTRGWLQFGRGDSLRAQGVFGVLLILCGASRSSPRVRDQSGRSTIGSSRRTAVVSALQLTAAGPVSDSGCHLGHSVAALVGLLRRRRARPSDLGTPSYRLRSPPRSVWPLLGGRPLGGIRWRCRIGRCGPADGSGVAAALRVPGVSARSAAARGGARGSGCLRPSSCEVVPLFRTTG